jgi:hypothetical protein
MYFLRRIRYEVGFSLTIAVIYSKEISIRKFGKEFKVLILSVFHWG